MKAHREDMKILVNKIESRNQKIREKRRLEKLPNAQELIENTDPSFQEEGEGVDSPSSLSLIKYTSHKNDKYR